MAVKIIFEFIKKIVKFVRIIESQKEIVLHVVKAQVN